MTQVWVSGISQDFTCPHCGAVYALKIKRLPARDTDEANCVDCGKVMASWNSTAAPSFTLKVYANGSPIRDARSQLRPIK